MKMLQCATVLQEFGGANFGRTKHGPAYFRSDIVVTAMHQLLFLSTHYVLGLQMDGKGSEARQGHCTHSQRHCLHHLYIIYKKKRKKIMPCFVASVEPRSVWYHQSSSLQCSSVVLLCACCNFRRPSCRESWTWQQHMHDASQFVYLFITIQVNKTAGSQIV